MTLTKPTKIGLAAGSGVLAIAIAYVAFRTPAVPGAGEKVEIVFDDGTKTQATWQEVFLQAQKGKAYLDRAPNGYWHYQDNTGKWGKVIDPRRPPATTTAPAP